MPQNHKKIIITLRKPCCSSNYLNFALSFRRVKIFWKVEYQDTTSKNTSMEMKAKTETMRSNRTKTREGKSYEQG